MSSSSSSSQTPDTSPSLTIPSIASSPNTLVNEPHLVESSGIHCHDDEENLKYQLAKLHEQKRQMDMKRESGYHSYSPSVASRAASTVSNPDELLAYKDNQIHFLHQQMFMMQQQLASLQHQYTGAQNHIGNLEGHIGNLEGHIGGLKGHIRNLECHARNLEGFCNDAHVTLAKEHHLANLYREIQRNTKNEAPPTPPQEDTAPMPDMSPIQSMSAAVEMPPNGPKVEMPSPGPKVEMPPKDQKVEMPPTGSRATTPSKGSKVTMPSNGPKVATHPRSRQVVQYKYPDPIPFPPPGLATCGFPGHRFSQAIPFGFHGMNRTPPPPGFVTTPFPRGFNRFQTSPRVVDQFGNIQRSPAYPPPGFYMKKAIVPTWTCLEDIQFGSIPPKKSVKA